MCLDAPLQASDVPTCNAQQTPVNNACHRNAAHGIISQCACMQLMRERGVHEGILMLRALTADHAFVWGLINCSPKDSSSAKVAAAHSFQPFLSATALSASVTDHSLRAANLHLLQLAPHEGASKKELASYIAAVGEVFKGAPPGSVPDTLVAGAADHLRMQYSTAVRRVRDALLEKSALLSRDMQCFLSASALILTTASEEHAESGCPPQFRISPCTEQ